jgi:hypothetical protein
VEAQLVNQARVVAAGQTVPVWLQSGIVHVRVGTLAPTHIRTSDRPTQAHRALAHREIDMVAAS